MQKKHTRCAQLGFPTHQTNMQYSPHKSLGRNHTPLRVALVGRHAFHCRVDIETGSQGPGCDHKVPCRKFHFTTSSGRVTATLPDDVVNQNVRRGASRSHHIRVPDFGFLKLL